METELVDQPSKWPTRKLTVGVTASSISGIIQAYVIGRFPTFADPVIWVPLPIILSMVIGIISGVIGMIAGWFVRDLPNVETDDVKVRGVGA